MERLLKKEFIQKTDSGYCLTIYKGLCTALTLFEKVEVSAIEEMTIYYEKFPEFKEMCEIIYRQHPEAKIELYEEILEITKELLNQGWKNCGARDLHETGKLGVHHAEVADKSQNNEAGRVGQRLGATSHIVGKGVEVVVDGAGMAERNQQTSRFNVPQIDQSKGFDPERPRSRPSSTELCSPLSTRADSEPVARPALAPDRRSPARPQHRRPRGSPAS